MGSRIWPLHNPVPLLPKPQPIAQTIAPIPILVPPMVDLMEVDLITGSVPGVKVRPKGESMDVVEPVLAEASNRAVQMAIGHKAPLKSVIPKRRKLVKTMMYHSIKDFVTSLFRPPLSTAAGTGAPP